jgi:hypothetical protein
MPAVHPPLIGRYRKAKPTGVNRALTFQRP